MAKPITAQPHSRPQTPFYYALLVAGIAILLYANTLGHHYCYDDYAVIVDNPATQKGWQGIPQIFTQKTYLPDREVYRPLTQATFAAEVALYGNNPMPAHIFNVLLYAATCVGVFYLFHLLFANLGIWLPAGAALLFAALPVHTEVVANIKSRDELLMLFFGLGALLAWVKGLQTQKLPYIGLALIAFTAAALCKENAVTLLGIMILVAYYVAAHPRATLSLWWKKHKPALLATSLMAGYLCYLALTLQTKQMAWYNLALLLPFLTLSFGVKWAGKWKQAAAPLTGMVLLLVAWGIGQYMAAVAETIAQPPTPAQPVQALNNILLAAQSGAQLVATILLILGKYLQLLIFPIILVYHYGYAQLPVANFTHPLVWVSIGLHIGLLWLMVMGLKRKNAVGFGIAFYFIALSVYSHITALIPPEIIIPISNSYQLKINAALYQTLPDTLAERFLLLPSAGFCLAMAYAIGYLTQQLTSAQPANDPMLKQVFTGSIMLLLLLYGGKTIDRNKVWKNNETLFSSDIVNMPHNAMGYVFYASVWKNKLAAATQSAEAQEYARRFENAQLKALEIYPNFLSALLTLGNFYLQTARYNDALTTFNNALNRFPKEPSTHFNLGFYYYEQQQYQQALPYFKEALALEPFFPEAYRYMAWSYFNLGLTEDAEAILQQGATRYPKKSHFFALSAHFYLLRQQYRLALTTAQKAAAIDPADKQALQTIIDAYLKLNLPDSANLYRQQLKKVNNE